MTKDSRMRSFGLSSTICSQAASSNFQTDILAFWQFYQQVNRKFAEAILPETREDGIIWVQDYQLFQVASSLRVWRPHSCIAFFLHIPFPPPDLYEKLPWRREVLQGLLTMTSFASRQNAIDTTSSPVCAT